MKTINYTHWKDGDFFIGFINEYPDYQTQGDSIEELKENLGDLWKDMESNEVPYIRKTDTLMVA